MPVHPIVDAHLHLWDPTRFRMGWLDGNSLLNKPYSTEDYRQHTEGLPIEAMVYLQVEVEPVYALLEAEWVEAQAQIDPRIQGIVAWAPLEYGDLARGFLEALKKRAPRLRGIRRIIQFEPDLEFCLRPGFIRGVQLLHEYDLSFDVCIDYRHFPNTLALIRQCPEVPCILDHIGKPNLPM
jgi:L-fuconolactonase